MRISYWSSDVCSSDLFELVDTHNDHVERELRAAIAALQPDGVILTPPHSDNPLIVGLLDQPKIPFARIGSRGGAAGIALTMDDEGSARRATRHLLALGHKRNGFTAGSPKYTLRPWGLARRTGEKGAAGDVKGGGGGEGGSGSEGS